MTTEGSDHHRAMAHSLDTTAVHAGRHDLTALGVHALPIDLSSTNPLPSIVEGGDSYENLATGGRLEPGQSPVYQRLWNPTVARLESAVAELEHTEDALAFASGMAALTAVLLATVQRGTPHVVAVRPLYGGTDHLLGLGLLGTEVTFAAAAEIAAAIRPDTGLVIVESPANPSLDLVDIRASSPRPARSRCSWTTRSPPPCSSSRTTSGPRWSCTPRPSSSAGTPTPSVGSSPPTPPSIEACAGSGPSPGRS